MGLQTRRGGGKEIDHSKSTLLSKGNAALKCFWKGRALFHRDKSKEMLVPGESEAMLRGFCRLFWERGEGGKKKTRPVRRRALPSKGGGACCKAGWREGFYLREGRKRGIAGTKGGKPGGAEEGRTRKMWAGLASCKRGAGQWGMANTHREEVLESS